jgi:hypothetical protein
MVMCATAFRTFCLSPLCACAFLQVPPGVFVFLNDIDFIPTPSLHSDLVSGKWASELKNMRNAYVRNGTRIALVTPAFERLSIKDPAGRPIKDASGRPVAVPYSGECSKATGCDTLQGMALPRTFQSLRAMMQEGQFVDVFHRSIVRCPQVLQHVYINWKGLQIAAPHHGITRTRGHCDAMFASHLKELQNL